MIKWYVRKYRNSKKVEKIDQVAKANKRKEVNQPKRK